MCLNVKQIDKNNKTLLDLRTRCVSGQNLQEAKGNSKTHSVEGQVRNAGGRHIFGFEREDDVQNTSIRKHAVENVLLKLTRNTELARAVDVIMTQRTFVF